MRVPLTDSLPPHNQLLPFPPSTLIAFFQDCVIFTRTAQLTTDSDDNGTVVEIPGKTMYVLRFYIIVIYETDKQTTTPARGLKHVQQSTNRQHHRQNHPLTKLELQCVTPSFLTPSHDPFFRALAAAFSSHARPL